MSEFEDVLKTLGWEDGFQIPIANDENKALEEELANLSLRKDRARNAVSMVSGRLGALKDHLKFVTQENEQTQKLITAHRRQLESTTDQYQVSKSEREITENYSRQLLKKLNESEEKNELKKSEVERAVAKADQLRAEMDWDTEAMKAWEEALKKRDDDIEMVCKHSKEDEIWFNELEAKRQHLQYECVEMRRKAAKLASETINYELIIERSGKVIKQLCTEREALTERWKETVKMLQQRDNDTVKMQERITETLEIIEKQKEKLGDANAFLKNENKNNHDLQLELESLNTLNSRLRKELNDLTQLLLLLNSELHTSKRQLMATAEYLEEQRMTGKRLISIQEEREILYEKYEQEIRNLEDKLKEMQGSNATSEQRIKHIEKMIDEKEKHYQIYLADTEKTNIVIFRFEKVIMEQKEIGKTLGMDLKNLMYNITYLRKHMRTQNHNLDKIKEVVYDVEFRIDDIEKRLYRLAAESKQGEKSDEKVKKIAALEKTVAEHKDVQHTLQNQVDRLQEEMRRLANLIVMDKETLAVLQNKCENHLLIYDVGLKQIQAAKKAIQEKQVEENMIRLHVDQIEKEKKNEEQEVYTLEKIRLSLDQAMKERLLEIDAKQIIIQTKKRNLEEDKGRLKSDLAIRRLKIEQIKKKYNIALMCLGKGEGGEALSLTHFKIKHAQEKFMLQQEGDDLDQKIKTAEKEIIAMENTLKLVNLTNMSFKKSLSLVKDEDEEIKKMKELEVEHQQIINVLKRHKNELAMKKKELDHICLDMEEILQANREAHDAVKSLEEDIACVKKQEQDKSEKLMRAECNLKKTVSKLGKRDVSKFQRDFEIRQLGEVNKAILRQLMKMTELYPEMASSIYQLMMKYSINIPESPPTPSTSGSSFEVLRSCSTTPPSNTTRLEQSIRKINLKL